jgi:hypothetical protein
MVYSGIYIYIHIIHIYGKIQQTSGYQDEIRNDISVIETRTMEGFDHQPYLLRCIGHPGLLISG